MYHPAHTFATRTRYGSPSRTTHRGLLQTALQAHSTPKLPHLVRSPHRLPHRSNRCMIKQPRIRSKILDTLGHNRSTELFYCDHNVPRTSTFAPASVRTTANLPMDSVEITTPVKAYGEASGSEVAHEPRGRSRLSNTLTAAAATVMTSLANTLLRRTHFAAGSRGAGLACVWRLVTRPWLLPSTVAN